MSELYAMRRANGDWFAFDEQGSFRVPVFHSSRDGMLARICHWGMQLFKPVALAGPALAGFVSPNGVDSVYFWLVDKPFTNLNRGRSLEQAQLALLVHNGGQPAQG